jgi:hypothetical protein
MEMSFSASGAWVDPEEPHVLRDTWLGLPVAFVYIPRHLLPAALVSPSLAVLQDLTPLLERPYGEVVSAWGPTTWLVSRDHAPRLLADLGAGATLVERLLVEIDRVVAAPMRRGRTESGSAECQ